MVKGSTFEKAQCPRQPLGVVVFTGHVPILQS